MIKELMFKWFGIVPIPCVTCEILRDQLDKSERERKDLLNRLLDKGNPEPPQTEPEEFKPIQPKFIPWNVRRQMLEAEDRKTAQLMKEKAKEISELEKELGVNDAVRSSNAQVQT